MDYLFFINPSLRMRGIIFFKTAKSSKTTIFLLDQNNTFLNKFIGKVSIIKIKKLLKKTIKNFLIFLNYFLKEEALKVSYYETNLSTIKVEKLFTFLIFNTTLFKKITKIITGGTFFLVINFFPLRKIKFSLLYCSIAENIFSINSKFDLIFLLINKKLEFLIFQNLKKKFIFFLLQIINIVNLPCFLISFNLGWKNITNFFLNAKLFLKYLNKHLLKY